jgi:peptidoglycan/LPS O-acetylase OafA/YrhL
LFLAVSNLGMPEGLVAPPTGTYLLHHLFAGTIGILLVSPAVLHERAGGRIRGLLESSAARSLGLVSYGIFLWHLPWIVVSSTRHR